MARYAKFNIALAQNCYEVVGASISVFSVPSVPLAFLCRSFISFTLVGIGLGHEGSKVKASGVQPLSGCS